jgi:hypothetical protein
VSEAVGCAGNGSGGGFTTGYLEHWLRTFSRNTVRRNWIPLSVSAMAHLLLIAVAVSLSRRSAAVTPERSTDATEPARHVDMIYVPPVQPARPSPPRRPTAPPPAKAQEEPEPEPNAPPEATRTSGNDSDDPSPATGEAPDGAARRKEAPAELATATLESEARRIFGRPRLRTAPGAGPQATRPMEAYLPENPERCVPHPAPQGDSAAAPTLGTVVGRIFRQDGGRPLAGAHLQMLGAPHTAFTDDNGEYRFRFDLALVDNCRTQYVRVTAPGYETRLLVLLVGENIQSEDVRLRRR